MRLLIITKHFPPRSEARALQAQRLVDALFRNSDVDLKVIAGLKQGSDSDLNKAKDDIIFVPYKEFGIKNIRLKLVCNQLAESYVSNKWLQDVESEYKKLIKLWQPEIIITLSSPIDAHWLTFKSTFKNEKVFNFFSDPWPKAILPYPYCRSSIPILSWYQKKLIRKLAKFSSGFVYTNDNVQPLLIANGVKAKEFHILRHFANETKEEEDYGLVNQESKKLITYTGSADEKRFTPDLVSALQEFLEKNESFVFVYAGTLSESLARVIFDKLGKTAFYLGNLNSKQLNKLLNDSDILINAEGEIHNSPFIPSKIADYVCSNSKILSISSFNSPTPSFLKSTDSLFESVENDKELIFKAIVRLSKVNNINHSSIDTVTYNNKIVESFLRDLS